MHLSELLTTNGAGGRRVSSRPPLPDGRKSDLPLLLVTHRLRALAALMLGDLADTFFLEIAHECGFPDVWHVRIILHR